LCALYDAGEPLGEFPSELIDDNKVRAALRGMDGTLIDFFRGEQLPAEQMAAALVEELTHDAAELGCSTELELMDDLMGGQTGAHRQLRHWERHGNLSVLVQEMIADTRA
jgi:gamma-glutamyl:cysteine ligase YbdK (ATP-grasp superfamily)